MLVCDVNAAVYGRTNVPRVRQPTSTESQGPLIEADRWQVSDGVLFSVFSSLLLWSLIVTGLHATLT